MDGEEGRSKSGYPGIACGFIEEEIQKDHRTDMQKQTDDVMTGSIRAEKIPIQHVGKPRQGMPITEICGCDCPFHACRIDARLDMNIFRDVCRIVEVDKIIVGNPAEGKE